MARSGNSLFKVTRDLWSQLPPNRRKSLVLLVLLVLASGLFEVGALGCIAFYVTAVSSPEAALGSRYVLMLRNIFPHEFFNSPTHLVITLSIAVVCLVTTKNLLQAVAGYSSAHFAAAVEGDLGSKLFKGFLEMPLRWHLKQNSADLILFVQWRHYVGGGFIHPWLQAVSEAALVILLLAGLTIFQPLAMLPLLLIFGGLAFSIFSWTRRRLDRCSNSCREYMGSLNRQVTKAVHGIVDVKVSGHAGYFTSQFSEMICQFASPFAMQHFLQRIPVWILESAGFLLLTSAISVLMISNATQSVRLTGLIAVLAVTAWRTLPALNRILASFTSLRSSLPYVNSINNLLATIDAHATSAPDARAERLPIRKGVRLDNIVFHYDQDEKKALDGVSLEIPKGSTIGIVGTSGAGKSTLVNILTGLLMPDTGRVLIDDLPLTVENASGWMRSIGYVPQSPYIHDGSLLENIAFGLSQSTSDRERALACCRMAALDEVISGLPDGIDTVIGERGSRLSGGQRQRVAIARALYQEPELLIFDEATSSLDQANERAIQNTIRRLKGNQTMVMIAHKLDTVRDCDNVLVLSDGRPVAFGPPDCVLPEYEEGLA
jgi:ABC-type multidrug transport system fused ATPase/permease subunit